MPGLGSPTYSGAIFVAVGGGSGAHPPRLPSRRHSASRPPAQLRCSLIGGNYTCCSVTAHPGPDADLTLTLLYAFLDNELPYLLGTVRNSI